jgi:hypothetical protein
MGGFTLGRNTPSIRERSSRAAIAALCLAMQPVCSLGCKSVSTAASPSNHLDWAPDQAVLAYADIKPDTVTVHNVRDCTYLTKDDYLLNYYDRTYDLNKLDAVDFIKVPFQGQPYLAHTMLSFSFADEDHLVVSVEIRKLKGQKYSAVQGALRQYHIMYVVGSERDLLKLRTNFRNDDVYLYRVNTTPEKVRALFVDVMQRVNELHDKPEFYDTITNNCTTNIARHINNLKPDRVPLGPEVLVNGYSDQFAYNLGLLDTSRPFPELQAQSEIGHIARALPADVDYSSGIRR